MFSNINYDYDILLSDGNDSVSSSCYSTDDEDMGRKFTLGDNILHSNPLEIISVRQITEVKENHNCAAINNSCQRRGVYFDECVSDLEDEEVCESDDNYDNSFLDSSCVECPLVMAYELPIVDRFQPRITKESVNTLNGVSDYCLQEKSRRMTERRDHLLHLTSIISSDASTAAQTAQTDENDALITKPVGSDKTVISNDILSNLSIDVLTEFINSDKPLKEIVSKSKKQSSCHIKKQTKSKKQNSKNMTQSKRIGTNKSTEKSDSLISSHFQYDEDHKENEKSSTEYYLQSPVQNKDIADSLLNAELNTDELISTDINNQIKPSTSIIDYNVSQSEPIITNQSNTSNSDHWKTENLSMSNIVYSLNQSQNDELDIANLSKISHNSAVADNSISFVDYHFNQSEIAQSIIISQLNTSEIDHLKICDNLISNMDNYMIQTQKVQLTIDNLSKTSENSTHVVDYNVSPIPNQETVVDTHSAISHNPSNSSTSKLYTNNQSKIKNNIEPNILEQIKFTTHEDKCNIDNPSRNLNNNKPIIDEHSKSLPTLTPIINNYFIQSPYDKCNINNQSKTSSEPDFKIAEKSISSSNFKSSMGKKTLPTEIKDLVRNSFNRFSHYNFLGEDLMFEQCKAENSTVTKVNELCHYANDDNDSKNSTTSSVDSGFHEPNICKEGNADTLSCFHSNQAPTADDKALVGTVDCSHNERVAVMPQTLPSIDDSQLQPTLKGFLRNNGNLNSKKISPFKQDFNCPNSCVQSREEISEFLYFQWLMFCEMHTLDNLI